MDIENVFGKAGDPQGSDFWGMRPAVSPGLLGGHPPAWAPSPGHLSVPGAKVIHCAAVSESHRSKTDAPRTLTPEAQDSDACLKLQACVKAPGTAVCSQDSCVITRDSCDPVARAGSGYEKALGDDTQARDTVSVTVPGKHPGPAAHPPSCAFFLFSNEFIQELCSGHLLLQNKLAQNAMAANHKTYSLPVSGDKRKRVWPGWVWPS